MGLIWFAVAASENCSDVVYPIGGFTDNIAVGLTTAGGIVLVCGLLLCTVSLLDFFDLPAFLLSSRWCLCLPEVCGFGLHGSSSPCNITLPLDDNTSGGVSSTSSPSRAHGESCSTFSPLEDVTGSNSTVTFLLFVSDSTCWFSSAA